MVLVLPQPVGARGDAESLPATAGYPIRRIARKRATGPQGGSLGQREMADIAMAAAAVRVSTPSFT
jgi:hypothetical protein